MWVDMAVKPTLNSSSKAPMIRKSNVAAGPLPNMKMSGVLVADAPRGAAAAMTRNTSAMPPMAPCLSWLLWPEPLLAMMEISSFSFPLLALKEIPNVGLHRVQQAIRDFSYGKSVYHFRPPIRREFKSWKHGGRQRPSIASPRQMYHTGNVHVSLPRGRASFAKHTTAPAPRR